MATKALPVISEGLLEFLSGAFPDQLPRGEQIPTREGLARLMGQQDVLRKLRELAAAQAR